MKRVKKELELSAVDLQPSTDKQWNAKTMKCMQKKKRDKNNKKNKSKVKMC